MRIKKHFLCLRILTNWSTTYLTAPMGEFVKVEETVI